MHFIAIDLAGAWPMKIFALVVLSILAGTILLVGSSYLDIYFRLFEASFLVRPVTTVSVVLAVALLLWFGPQPEAGSLAVLGHHRATSPFDKLRVRFHQNILMLSQRAIAKLTEWTACRSAGTGVSGRRCMHIPPGK